MLTTFRTCGTFQVLAAALAALLLVACQASGDVLGPNGQPDPSYKGGAMQVWLRADSGVTASGGSVSKWKDQSNQGNDATQAKRDDQPIHAKESFGGRDVVKFAGNGDHLQFATGFDEAFSGSFTMFFLLAPDDGYPGRDSVWFGLESPAGPSRVILNNSGKETGLAVLYKAGGNSDNIEVSPNPFSDGPASQFTLITWVFNDEGANQIFVNGNPEAAATINGDADNSLFSSGTINAYIGAAQYRDGSFSPSKKCTFAGGISEFIIYKGALSNKDRRSVEKYFLSRGGLADQSSPDYRPAIDKTAISVRTISDVNPWFPLDYRRWVYFTPDRPTLFGVAVPKGRTQDVQELERNAGQDDQREPLIKQYEKEVVLAEECGVDALMIESMTSGIWWPVTPKFMQAADNAKTKTKIGIFLTGRPDGETPEAKRKNFVSHIKMIVEECDRHEKIWRINGKPVVMLYPSASFFPPLTWRQIQAELDAEGKDCIWLMSGERVGWNLDELAEYLPVMDGVAHYANYGAALFKEKVAKSMIPWMHKHYPQKLIYPGVQQNHAQSWSFGGGGSELTKPIREMCEASLTAGVDGLNFTNWSDFIENSRLVPSEMGDRALAEIFRHYRSVLLGNKPGDEREKPLFALSYLDSTVHGTDLKFELLAFPFRTGSSGKARIALLDENGKVLVRSGYKQFSMTKLSEVMFRFRTSDWPYNYTLTPVAEIEFSNGPRTETVTLPGTYMMISPDREASQLARSVCSSSILPVDECSVLSGDKTTLGNHSLHLKVRAPETYDEIRLVRNTHVIQTWMPSSPNWQEDLTLQRGPVGFLADGQELVPGVPPFDIYHLEVWTKDARRAWSNPLILQNLPDGGNATTSLSKDVQVTAPRNAFVTSRYSFDSLIGRLVPDEGGFDFHGALGAGALTGKSRGFGYTGQHSARGVFHYYHGGEKAVPKWAEGGVGGSRCLEFDGEDDCVFFWSNVLPPCSWTIAVWLSPEAHRGDDLNLWSTRSAGMAAYLDKKNRPVVQGWTPGKGWQTATGQEPIPPNGWHHIACTYDSKTMRLFVDGKEVAKVEPQGQVSPSLPYMMLGCRLNYKGEKSDFFKGKMDNLFITGRPLGLGEIRALAREPMSN